MTPNIAVENRTSCRTTPNRWQWPRIWRYLLLGFFVAAIFSGCTSYPTEAQSAPGAQVLPLGSVLPDVSGETLTGSPNHVLDLVNGRVAIVIFSFSKDGGKDAQNWNEHLNREYSGNPSVACSTVIELQDAPRLLRGIIKSALSRDMPPYIRERTIVTYQDEALWKRRLGVTDPGRAYVLVLGEGHQILWRSSKAFTALEFDNLESSVLQQLRNARVR